MPTTISLNLLPLIWAKSDNAHEYFSLPFTTNMGQNGIIHQSCSYTPKQNGEVERKNCYLLEVAHALL